MAAALWPFSRAGPYAGDIGEEWVSSSTAALKSLIAQRSDSELSAALVQVIAGACGDDSGPSRCLAVVEDVWAALGGAADAPDGSPKDTLAPDKDSSNWFRAGIADALWTVDCTIRGGKAGAQESSRFDKVVEALANSVVPRGSEASYVDSTAIILHAELPLSRSCAALSRGGPSGAAESRKAAVRQITRKLYAQSRFNVFAESNEGFAKLVETLAIAAALTAHRHSAGLGKSIASEPPESSCPSSSSSAAAHSIDSDTAVDGLTASELASTISALVGAFRLDPTRTCNLVLEAFGEACALTLPTPSNRRPALSVLPTDWQAAVALFRPFHVCTLASQLLQQPARSPREASGLYTAIVLLVDAGTLSLGGLLPGLLAAWPEAAEALDCDDDDEEEREEQQDVLGGEPEGNGDAGAKRVKRGQGDSRVVSARLTSREVLRAAETEIAEAAIVRIGGGRGAGVGEAGDRSGWRRLATLEGGHNSTRGLTAGTLAAHPLADRVAAEERACPAAGVAAAAMHVCASRMEAAAAPGDGSGWASCWAVATTVLRGAAGRGAVQACWQPGVCAAACRVGRACCAALLCGAHEAEAAAGRPPAGWAPSAAKLGGTPRVATWAGDVAAACSPVLALLGAHLGNDGILTGVVSRAASLTAAWAQTQPDSMKEWGLRQTEALLRDAVLPAASVSGGATATGLAAWEALSRLPWHRRFRLYTWWHDGVYGLAPLGPTQSDGLAAMMAGSADAAAPSLCARGAALPGEVCARLQAARTARLTRQALKRVAKDTAAQAAKTLGRLLAAAPMPSLSTLIAQLERFDNLIEPAMDALRFATPMAVDAVIFLLCARLASDAPGEGSEAEFDGTLARRGSAQASPLGRATLQADVLPSQWVLNLASTAAWAVRKLPSADPAPLLLLLSRRLADGSLGHLPLLQELLAVAGGVSKPGNMTADQMAAVGASLTLQTALGYSTLAPSKSAVLRLRHALKRGWGAGPATVALWVQAAQATEGAAFTEAAQGARYIKMVAMLHDTAAEALQQMTDLIGGTGLASRVQSMLDEDADAVAAAHARARAAKPGTRVTISALVSKGASVARLVDPPAVEAMVPSITELTTTLGLSPANAFRLLRPWLRGASMPRIPRSCGAIPPPTAAAAAAASTTGADGHSVPLTRWAITGRLLEAEVAALPAVPSGVFPPSASSSSGSEAGQMNPLLYCWFWGLELYDLHYPKDLYRKGEDAARAALEAKEREADAANADDESGDASAAARRRRDMDGERKRAATAIRQLRREAPEHGEHVARVRAAFAASAPWFTSSAVPASQAAAEGRSPSEGPPLEWGGLGQALAKHCLLPRAALSQADAVYSARFLRLIHESDLPEVGSMRCLNSSLFGATRRLLSSTEQEAVNLGSFLAEVLSWVASWRDDSAAYAREASARRGLLKAFTRAKAPAGGSGTDETEKLSFSLFTRVCGRWDEVISNTLCDLLASPEPMRRKAALLVTKRLSGVSPRAPADLCAVLAAIKQVADATDEHKDLRVLATSTAADVERRLRVLGLDANGDPVRAAAAAEGGAVADVYAAMRVPPPPSSSTLAFAASAGASAAGGSGERHRHDRSSAQRGASMGSRGELHGRGQADVRPGAPRAPEGPRGQSSWETGRAGDGPGWQQVSVTLPPGRAGDGAAGEPWRGGGNGATTAGLSSRWEGDARGKRGRDARGDDAMPAGGGSIGGGRVGGGGTSGDSSGASGHRRGGGAAAGGRRRR